ncbi:MAG: hypothetical protein VR78_12555 [Hoeflea sp. BRH_c9]|nr:MAG: hypothetical protein VR78_12555 [Hoeflea sp. BRH_c9]
MGHLASGVGSALVSGPGALWQNSGVLYVGEYGAGTLNIEDGGEVVNTFGYIGLNPDSSGEVTVSDASWQNASNLYVASGGNGALRVEAGGTVSNVTGFIGFYAGSNGAAAVSNASWHNSHDLYIGREGSGSLSIDDGGAVANVDGLIGFYEGSNGSVAVSGAGTKWQNSGDLFVGQEGTGSLSVADGGTVFNTNGSVGTAPGSVGTATVSGQDASWQNSGYLRIGEHGAGTLTIENGGTVSNTHGYLGLGTSATGIATITGSGSTWINGGSLIVGDFGHGTMNIGDGGTVSNVDGIVGYNSGSLGTVTVSGADTSWQNSGFFFYIGYDSNSTGTLIITDGGTVSNNNSFIGTVSDSIGAVTVSGADAAWQNSGSLNVGHSGTGALTIEDGGTVFNTQGTIGAHTGSSGAVTVSGAGASWQNSASLRVGLVGNGTLTVADGGVVSALAMEVANNDTSTGTLSIGAAAGDAAVAAGAVETDTITFGAGNGALVFNHTAIDYLFDPALSGSGHVNHFAGTTILTGDSAGFSGATTVHAGTLVVNGVLGGTLDVLANGRLEGAGTVGTTKLASGATVAPGNSIGTLDVVGDISFDAGSIYEVEVDPAGSDSDLIHATGTATLNGGSVAHIGLVGAYQPFATYTILTADGGVAGTFDDVASAFAFLDPTLSYDPNNVFLKLVRNDIAFCGVGLTFNQCATGEGAESLGFGHPLHDALVVLDEDTARAAFDRLSGEIQGSVKGAMLEDSRFLREAATTRVRAAFSGVAASPLPVIAYGDGGPAAAPADTDRLAAWGHAFGSWGEWNSDGNAASFDRSIGGFFVGGDGLVAENLRLGLLAGYSRSSFDVDDRSSSGSTSNYHLGIYGGTQLGNFGFRAGAAYSWHDVETFRQVGFPGFSDTLAADYDAATTQGFGELGYRIDTRAASFEPFANLAYVNVHTDGFVETGGAAALSGASSSTDATFTTLGLRASTGFMLGTMNATARGMLGLRHAFGDVTPLSTHAFTGGDAFTVAGVPIAGDAAILEAGFDLVISPNVVLGFSYSGQIASKVDDHGLKADLAVKF